MLESRLNVALHNSKCYPDSECPLFMPDDPQNLLLGYVEEAQTEWPCSSNVFLFLICDMFELQLQ